MPSPKIIEFNKLASDKDNKTISSNEISVRTKALKKLIVNYLLTDESFTSGGKNNSLTAEQIINRSFDAPSDEVVTIGEGNYFEQLNFQKEDLSTLKIFIKQVE